MSVITFSMFNHLKPSFPSLEDLFRPYAYALQDMGHQVGVMQDRIANDALNIFIECFTDEQVKFLKKRKDIRYAIIQTELMTGDTFNNDHYFRNRYKNFIEMAKGAEFVINIVGDTKVPCPSLRVEPGYHPKLELPENDNLIENDLYFFGTMSHRREEIIHLLANREMSIRISSGASMDERNEEIQKARFVLGIKCHWPVDFVSLTRVSAALHAKRPVIYEDAVPQPIMGNIPLIYPNKGEFVDWVESTLKDKKGWKKIRDQQVLMFKSFPIERQLRLGLLEQGITI